MKAQILRTVGATVISAATFAASFLWMQNRLNGEAEERARGKDEFQSQQIRARDRELDDLKSRVLHLEERCK